MKYGINDYSHHLTFYFIFCGLAADCRGAEGVLPHYSKAHKTCRRNATAKRVSATCHCTRKNIVCGIALLKSCSSCNCLHTCQKEIFFNVQIAFSVFAIILSLRIHVVSYVIGLAEVRRCKYCETYSGGCSLWATTVRHSRCKIEGRSIVHGHRPRYGIVKNTSGSKQ